MRTSEEWWNDTKSDNTKLVEWLKKQYCGEITAVTRINDFKEKFVPKSLSADKLERIAKEEAQHASWVGDLLKARGIEPKLLDKEDRYWDKTLPNINDFFSGCAVAAHAEKMRLERIRVIADDEMAPADVREVFRRILKDEVGHEETFRTMAGGAAMEAAAEAHNKGREAIGLFPESL